MRSNRALRENELIPDQVLLPFRGIADFFVRCLAALSEARLGDVGVTLVDTGTPDAEVARMAGFCKDLGLDLTLVRGTGREIFDRKYLLPAWGGVPRRVIMLNSDTIPTPGFAQRLLGALDLDPKRKFASAVSTTPLDIIIHRAGFEDGSETTLLERVYRYHQQRQARYAGQVTDCAFANMTCAALDWAAWAEVAPGETPFDYGHHYDLHIGNLLRDAGYTLGVCEDCAVYHIGHATFRQVEFEQLYDNLLGRTLQYIDRWGHLPEHFALMHEMLYTSERFPH